MANPHVDDLDKMQRCIGFFDTRTPRKFFRLVSPWKVPMIMGVQPACGGKGLVIQVRMLEAGSFAICGPNGKPLTLRRIDATESPLGPAVQRLSAPAYANLIVLAE